MTAVTERPRIMGIQIDGTGSNPLVLTSGAVDPAWRP